MNALFYVASTMPLGDSTVTSNTALFIPQWDDVDIAPNDVVCFVGSAMSLEPDLKSENGGGGSDCTAGNGCGVHVHAGMGCEDKDAQGGHWWNDKELKDDPWALVGYLQTDSDGYGQYASCVRTGFDVSSDPDMLVGHAFIVHANDGSRVSCGIIGEAPVDYEPVILSADIDPIPGVDDKNTTMTGSVSVLTGFNGVEDIVSDAVCYMGYAMGLEPDIESFLVDKKSKDCDAANGCGAHIHSGTGCKDKDKQGGHYYDADDIAEDPWKLESYYETDGDGEAALIGCVITGAGASSYEDRPFIVHKEDGGRLLCGILEEESSGDPGEPVEAPVDPPVEAPVEAPVEEPVEAPVEAPVEVPVEAPVEAPVEPPPPSAGATQSIVIAFASILMVAILL